MLFYSRDTNEKASHFVVNPLTWETHGAGYLKVMVDVGLLGDHGRWLGVEYRGTK